MPYRADIGEVAAYFQAADVYLHAAKAETLPTTILEALASGLPVVATAVGGIPEELRSLSDVPGAWSGTSHARSEATGVLVATGDAVGMGAADGDDPGRRRPAIGPVGECGRGRGPTVRSGTPARRDDRLVPRHHHGLAGTRPEHVTPAAGAIVIPIPAPG